MIFFRSILPSKLALSITFLTFMLGIFWNAPQVSAQTQTQNATSGVTFYAQNYSGDLVTKLNTCISAVITAGGGECNAQSLTGTQTGTGQVSLGNSSQNVGVTLRLPNSAHWTFSESSPTACAIMQYGGTSIIGDQPGGGGSLMIFDTASSSSMDSVYCTYGGGTVYSMYVLAEGFFVQNNGNATLANGEIHIRNVGDESRFERIMAANSFGDVWHVENICCGTVFDNIQGFASSGSNYSAGGVPLTIGKTGTTTSQIGMTNSTFNAPKTGLSNIVITGNVSGLTMQNIYMEGNGSVDTTTPMVTIGNNVYGVLINGISGQQLCGTACPSKYIFASSSTGPIAITQAFNQNGSFMNDIANAVTIPSVNNGSTGAYFNSGQTNYFGYLRSQLLSTDACTVASGTTISPACSLINLTGTTSIATISLPVITSDTAFTGCFDILPASTVATTTAGNIHAAYSLTGGTLYRACYLGSKWYIK